MGEYAASDHSAGGIGVYRKGNLVGWLNTPTQPVVVRFTGEFVCNMEHLGHYYEALNIVTGKLMQQQEAQHVCPILWNPEPDPYVRGLKQRYKIRYHWMALP